MPPFSFLLVSSINPLIVNVLKKKSPYSCGLMIKVYFSSLASFSNRFKWDLKRNYSTTIFSIQDKCILLLVVYVVRDQCSLLMARYFIAFFVNIQQLQSLNDCFKRESSYPSYRACANCHWI
uniref:Uncharacterized protein n=1 Tax=Opuntia streptacantha TaxID=393608 RepID=A0A7C9EUA6_OPUST